MANKLTLAVIYLACVSLYNVKLVSSAAPPQPGNTPVAQPQTHYTNPTAVNPSNQDQDQLGGKPGTREAPYSQYNYRGGPVNNQRSPSYPNNAVANYARDAYGTGRDASANPFLALSSDADFQLSAYFGQVFWGLLAVTVTIILCFWLIRFFVGTDVVGGLVDKIRDSGATAKSLDLDRITNMVYDAIDTYGKYAAKGAMHHSDVETKKY